MRTASLRCLLILLVLAARGRRRNAPADDTISPEHRQLMDAAEHLIKHEQFDAAIELLDRYLQPDNEDSVNAVSQVKLYTELGAIKARAEEGKAAAQKAKKEAEEGKAAAAEPPWLKKQLSEWGQETLKFFLGLLYWMLLGLFALAIWWFGCWLRGRRPPRSGLLVGLKAGTGDDPAAASATPASQDFNSRIISRLTGRPPKGRHPDIILSGDYDGSVIGSVTLYREAFLKELPIKDDEALAIGPIKLSPRFVYEAVKKALRRRYEWELHGTVSDDDAGVTVAAVLTGPKTVPLHLNVHKPAGPGAGDEAISEIVASLAFGLAGSTATESLDSHVAATQARSILEDGYGSKSTRERYETAERHLRAAVDHDRLNIAARCDLAVVIRQLGRYQDAIPHLRMALDFLQSDEQSELADRLSKTQPHLKSTIRYNLASALAKFERDRAAHSEAMGILAGLRTSLPRSGDDDTTIKLSFLVVSTMGHATVFKVDELQRHSRKADRNALTQDQVAVQEKWQQEISQRLQEVDDMAKRWKRKTDPGYLSARTVLLNALGRSEYLRYRTRRKPGVKITAKIENAKQQLREAMTVMPDFANADVANATLASVCLNLASAGRYPRSNPMDDGELQGLLERAIELKPDNPRAHLLLGHHLALRRVGQYARAAEHLEKDPQDRWASRRLAEIYDEELNRPAAAARAAIRCLEDKSRTTKDDDSWRLRLGQVVLAIDPDTEAAAGLVGLLFSAIKHAEKFAGATADEEKRRQAHTLLSELKKRLLELRPCSVVAPPAVKDDLGGTLMLRAYRQGT